MAKPRSTPKKKPAVSEPSPGVMRLSGAQVRVARKELEVRERRAAIAGGLLDVVERGTQAMSLAGGFASARNDGRLRAGRPSGGIGAAGAAWSHRDSWSLASMRRYCQEAYRDNPRAVAVVRGAVNLILRDGFTTNATTEEPEWNKKADALFARWAEDKSACDLEGARNLDGYAAGVLAACFTDGDQFVNLVDEGAGKLQTVEAERVKNPSGKWDGIAEKDGKKTRMVGGVESDGEGRPRGIHVSDWMSTGGVTKTQTRFLEHGTYLHCRNPGDIVAGAVRTVPQLQSVVKLLEDLESTEEAVRTSIWVQACLTVFITLNDPAAGQANAFDTAEESETGTSGNTVTRRTEALAPGMINRLNTNEGIHAITPSQPGSNYQTYLAAQHVIVGAAIGVPECVAFLDGKQLNLSTIRSVIQLAWREMERWQTALANDLYRPVRKWWTARAIARGELPARDDWDSMDVAGPPAPVMDPKTEYEAAKLAIDNRLTSRPREIARIFGHDAEAVDREQAESEERLKTLGIPVVGLPGAVMPGATAAPEGEKPEGEENNGEGGEQPAPEQQDNNNAPKPGAPKAAKPVDGANGGYLVGDKTAAIDLAKSVAAKKLPADSAKAVLTTMVGLDDAAAGSIIDPASSFEAAPDAAPVPAPGGGTDNQQ
jgi:lambda family phage portal protein